MASSEALCGRLQTDIDLKSSADAFYNLWRKEAHKIPTASSQHIQAIDLHEGDWHEHGHVKSWSYTVDGKQEVFKEKVEFDDATKTVTLHGIEGDLYNQYKVYHPICKVVPKSKGGAVAKLVLGYERLNEDVPIPTKYMDVFVSMTKDLDAHACQASA